MKKFKLISLLETIIREEVEEVRITPQEYLNLLKRVAGQAHGILTLPQFKGKKLVVTGSLDLSKDKRITDLGPIKIEGSLDVSYTNIKSLDNVEVTGYSRYWYTPWDKELQRRIQRKKAQEQEERRENDEWNLNDTDTEGEMANAVFQYAMDNGLLNGIDDDEKQRAKEIEVEIKGLEDQQERLEDDEDYSDRYDEIQEQIDELQDEWDEIMSGKVDVYDLYPTGRHYDLYSFESLENGYEFAVGTERQADDSLYDYYGDWVDSPREYMSPDSLSHYVDGDEVADYFEDYVREDIRENPDVYDIEKTLSGDQEEEIWLLEMERWVYENEGVRAPISEPTKEEGNVFDFEDAEGNRFQYKNTSTESSKSHWVLYKDGQVVPPHQIYDDEDTEEHEDERNSRISDIEYEIDEIKENPDGEPDEDDIEREVDSKLDEIRRDPADYLEQMGYDSFDNFLDTQRLREDLINEGDYGNLNGYDGNYDIVDINDTNYVVMRTN